MKTFTLAKLLALAGVVSAGSWNCPVNGGGPGADRVGEAVGYYEAAFGAGSHTVGSLFTQGVKCNGLAYLAVNTVGYDTQDTPEKRDQSAADAGFGDGKRCVWSDPDQEGQSYEFGNDDDFTCGALGGTATCACDIRDCNGNTIVGGSC